MTAEVGTTVPTTPELMAVASRSATVTTRAMLGTRMITTQTTTMTTTVTAGATTGETSSWVYPSRA